MPTGDDGPPYTITLAEAARAPELSGGKAHTLSRLMEESGIPGPRGWVITTNAFRNFLAHNHLRHRLDELLAQVPLDDWDRLTELCREMTALVQHAAIPPAVSLEIEQRLEDFRLQGLEGPWALRSSALSEDGEASFAGQYASVLQVAAPEVCEAYKKVLASKYSPPAVAYRIRIGLADQETPMAVLTLEMIEAAMSGVVYTSSPEADGLRRPAWRCLPCPAWAASGGRQQPARSPLSQPGGEPQAVEKPLRSHWPGQAEPAWRRRPPCIGQMGDEAGKSGRAAPGY